MLHCPEQDVQTVQAHAEPITSACFFFPEYIWQIVETSLTFPFLCFLAAFYREPEVEGSLFLFPARCAIQPSLWSASPQPLR